MQSVSRHLNLIYISQRLQLLLQITMHNFVFALHEIPALQHNVFCRSYYMASTFASLVISLPSTSLTSDLPSPLENKPGEDNCLNALRLVLQKYNRLAGLNNRNLFSQSWSWEVQGQCVNRFWGWWGPVFLWEMAYMSEFKWWMGGDTSMVKMRCLIHSKRVCPSHGTVTGTCGTARVAHLFSPSSASPKYYLVT